MTTVEAHHATSVRPRVFTYRASTEWLGRRKGRLVSSGRDPLVVSSPPEFRGEPGLWTPEELFLGAIDSCFMITFASMVEKHHLPVEGYFSEVSGVLESADGHYRFTSVTIRPTVIISERAAAEKTLQALEMAHRDCLISNSVTPQIMLEPDVEMSVAE